MNPLLRTYTYTVSQLEEESEGVGAQLCVWYCNTLCSERNKTDLFAQFDHDLFWGVQLLRRAELYNLQQCSLRIRGK